MDQTSNLLTSMSDSVYQTLLETHQQHPNWFQEKFRLFSWERAEFKDKFITRLVKKLTSSEDIDSIILKIITLLLNIFLPSFFESQKFTRLVVKLRLLNNSHHNFSPLLNEGLAVLLLDAENLSLEIKMEKLLERLSSYPLKIKLAVANWRSLGKKDEELRQRGYDLIHVPKGKNSADLEMIALGTTLFLDSSLVKEVFVCSSDKDLEPLMTKLNQNGLIVHRVCRQADEMIIVNRQTNKTQKYSINCLPDIPSLQDFIDQLKHLISEEQKRSQKNWIQLARLSQLFQEKNNLKINQIVNYLLPGKRARDIFIEFKEDFAVHQLSENEQIYITLFNENKEFSATIKNFNNPEITQEMSPQESFKTAVVKIVQTLTEQSKQEYIPIGNVASQFQNQFNLPITKALQKIQLSKKLTNFLKSCEQLKLKQDDKGYQVALK